MFQNGSLKMKGKEYTCTAHLALKSDFWKLLMAFPRVLRSCLPDKANFSHFSQQSSYQISRPGGGGVAFINAFLFKIFLCHNKEGF